LAGNGAVILTYPDEPINLANNLDVTWGTVIGLEWDEGSFDAGTPVLDFTIFCKDDVSNTWSERQVGVLGTSATLEGFTLGVTYYFQVKSRNAFDFSVGYSNTIAVLAAKSPEQPEAPLVAIDDD